jgi:hypothetical protein
MIMNTRTYLLTAAVCLIILSPPTAFGEVLHLKNGKLLHVEKAWQDSDEVWFVFQGMKASIPRNKVSDITSEAGNPPKPGAPEDQRRADNNGDSPSPAVQALPNRPMPASKTDSAVQEPTGAAKKTLVLRPDGFDDLKWGVRVDSVTGLEIRSDDPDLPEVTEYVRPQDPLKIGEAALASVVYAFWRDQLYTVTLWAQGPANFEMLRNRVFEEFGVGIQTGRSNQKYLWSDETTDMMLTYSDESQQGMLWMRCKKLDRKFKLSKLSGPASYLKSMKSRN